MADRRRPRAVRVPVAEPLAGGGHDYADAFEVRLADPDHRTAEQWLRAGLEQAPAPVRRTIRIAHRHVLRFRLGPPSPDRVLGWDIATSTPGVFSLQTRSSMMRAAIVVRRRAATSTTLTTVLHYDRPVLCRVVWTLVGPLHRRIAPLLLARAAALGSSDPLSATAGGRGGPWSSRRPGRAGAAGSRQGSSAWRRR